MLCCSTPGPIPTPLLRCYDAISAIKVPVIEVHLSDPETREPFRHMSYVGMAAISYVNGLGPDSYDCARRYGAALRAL